MIFRNPLRLKIYLYPERIDMRKSWSGLLSLVQEGMRLNAYEESLFVFCGRSGRLVKLMYWDGNGFCIWMKKLEQGVFPFGIRDGLKIRMPELRNLLSGIDARREHRIMDLK
ncbi:MAG TPA: IS66 family insertion sequence element accessory protein TnpB [Leptospiraceae bacterium]|nr:IS66 family insertion sequence element accessory protein TnpB [Rhodocyclaceae bacterium]HNI25114.1 IS66 family insertion sequence element accessory protein TnpB [Leptospiraceae bacterium]